MVSEESLKLIAEALQRMAPAPAPAFDSTQAHAFIFDAERKTLRPVHKISALPLALLQSIDRSLNSLVENSERFALGHSANNALLWGARGMGKSSLVKACHHALMEKMGPDAPALIEIHREDIVMLPDLLGMLKNDQRRFILFCDDLSFHRPDQDFKALKSVLDGGIDGKPDNVIFYATANRRHLLPREMIQNESSTAINPAETVDETLALSDRFGLWLGFYPCSQDAYLTMVDAYINHFKIPAQLADIKDECLNWSKTRGSRSGRVAWQYIQDLAGRHGMKIRG